MRWVLGLLLVLVLVVGGGLFWAMRYQEIAPIAGPPTDLSAELLETGELLTAVGDCVVCHTSASGEPYAGGLPLETPFGTIHSTNLTPDVDTGIGTWPLEAFRRAMHEGVDREGQYLYPAFPYDHFTRVSDTDIEAIYTYLMNLDPVVAETPENELGFPFNQRILLAGWNLLFHENARFEPDPDQSEEWNRGAYLAEGLGHCGACHTPRNALGAVDDGQHFDGASVEGWHAPALNELSPSLVPWTADTLVNYFLDGRDDFHGVAAGPMTPVVNELSYLSEDDAYALAAYILSFQDQTDIDARIDTAEATAESLSFGSPETPSTGPTPSSVPAIAAGQATFARVCSNCHRSGTATAPLGGDAAVNGPDPSNLIHVILEGIVPPDAAFNSSMPAFGGSLTNEDVFNLVSFMRDHFSDEPAWVDLEASIERVRSEDAVGGTETVN